MIEIPSTGLHLGANKTGVFSTAHTATAPLPAGVRDSIGAIDDAGLSPTQIVQLERTPHGGTKGIAVDKEGKLFKAITPKEAYKEQGILAGAKAYTAATIRTLGKLIHDNTAMAAAALGGTALAAAGIGTYESDKSYKKGEAAGAEAAALMQAPPQVPSYY